MKKTYQTPSMTVVRLVQHLLTDTSMIKDGSTTISDNNQVLSRRRGSSWDDDDYDE